MTEIILPELIYRPIKTSTAKALSLHKEVDFVTGLSFLSYEPMGKYFIFKTARLLEHGYTVRPDGDKLIMNIWTNQPYQDGLYFDGTARFDFGHVSVWHPDFAYLSAWYQLDKLNLNTVNISQPLQALFDLREVES